jgi:hypothetical protein
MTRGGSLLVPSVKALRLLPGVATPLAVSKASRAALLPGPGKGSHGSGEHRSTLHLTSPRRLLLPPEGRWRHWACSAPAMT